MHTLISLLASQQHHANERHQCSDHGPSNDMLRRIARPFLITLAEASDARGSSARPARRVRPGSSARPGPSCTAASPAAGPVGARPSTGQSGDGGDITGGGRSTGSLGPGRLGLLGIILVHVGAGAEQTRQHRVVARDGHGALDALVVHIHIARLPARGRRVAGGLVALDVHLLEHAVVVSVRLHVRGVPVDQPARPLDRALAVFGDSGRPEGELHAGGGLRVVVLVVGLVEGVGFFEGALDGAVDGPGELVGLPVDFVGVVVGEGVLVVGHGDVFPVVVWDVLVAQ